MMAYHILMSNSKDTFEKDIRDMLARAQKLADDLNALNQHAWILPLSNTIVFDKPSSHIVNKWQLATVRDTAHLMISPHGTQELIDEFLIDLKADIATR